MTSGLLGIGELAKRSNTSATTLRYYDELGLVKPVERSSGRRRYDINAIQRLRAIALCKSAGFTLDEIRLLLHDNHDDRRRSRELAARKLATIDAQIDELQQARLIIEWGLRCTCTSLEACTCTIHSEAESPRELGQNAALRSGTTSAMKRSTDSP